GESRRIKVLQSVGRGLGAYDSLGNYVGVGDYTLQIAVGPALDRVARSATSALLAWHFGSSEAWRGSRVECDFESEARRLGDVRLFDPIIPPGAVLTDPMLHRGSVTQRFETELLPGSRYGATRVRLERRVSGDRGYENFAQTEDARSLSAR